MLKHKNMLIGLFHGRMAFWGPLAPESNKYMRLHEGLSEVYGV